MDGADSVGGLRMSMDGDLVFAGEKVEQGIAAGPIGSEAVEVDLGFTVCDAGLACDSDTRDSFGQLDAAFVEIGVPLLGGEHGGHGRRSGALSIPGD